MPVDVISTFIWVKEVPPETAIEIFLESVGMLEFKAEEVHELIRKFPKFTWPKELANNKSK